MPNNRKREIVVLVGPCKRSTCMVTHQKLMGTRSNIVGTSLFVQNVLLHVFNPTCDDTGNAIIWSQTSSTHLQCLRRIQEVSHIATMRERRIQCIWTHVSLATACRIQCMPCDYAERARTVAHTSGGADWGLRVR